MLPYCLKCRKNTKNLHPKKLKTKNYQTILSSNYVMCGSKKSRFRKEQESSGLINSFDIKSLLIKIPLFGKILF